MVHHPLKGSAYPTANVCKIDYQLDQSTGDQDAFSGHIQKICCGLLPFPAFVRQEVEECSVMQKFSVRESYTC